MFRRARTVVICSLFFVPAGGVGATTLTVVTNIDADAPDGFCSLREAIVAANTDAAYRDCPAGAGADRIGFALPLPATIVLAADLPAITDTLAIRGPGGAALAIDGDEAHRLFQLDSASDDRWLLVEDLALTRGRTETGGKGGAVLVSPGETAIFSRVLFLSNTSDNGGGAIAVSGVTATEAHLTLVDCELEDNRSLGPSGGGAISVLGASTAEVTGSALLGNRAEHENGAGGAIFLSSGGTLSIVRSTLSGNVANSSGGAIFVVTGASEAMLEVFDSTLTLNVAGALLDTHGDGGGIYNGSIIPAYLTIRNTIVAGNVDLGTFLDQPDLSLGGGTALSLSGASLVGANDGASTYFPAGAPNANGDFVGSVTAPIDPMLSALDFHGGATRNHGPLLDPASPVIDHGRCAGADADQRGHGNAATHLRIVDSAAVPDHPSSDGCDIGAVERGASAGAATFLFADDFELGHALLWSLEAP